MAKVSVRCPKADCGTRYEIDETLLGKRARCKKCQKTFVLTRTASPALASGQPSPPAAPDEPAAPQHQGRQPAAEDQIPAVWQAGDVILDLYEVKGVLGEGGMGTVYRVHHRGWDLDLAVKSPRPELLAQAGSAENFEREAETWVNLGLHPHIASCHYVRRLGGIPRIFAECIDAGSLRNWIYGPDGQPGRLYEGGPEQALVHLG